MKHLALATLSLILLSACAKSPLTIPEITPDLENDTWIEAEKTGTLAGIITHANHLYLIRTSGTILKINPHSGERVMTAQVPHTLNKGITAAKGVVLTRSATSGDWIILDLDSLKEKARIKPDSPESKIVALGKEYLVSMEKDKIGIQGFINGHPRKEWPLNSNDFRSCRIAGGKILLLLRDELVDFSLPELVPEHHPLPHPAAGGFLLRGGYIYYGSEDRLLVKWFPGSRKAVWTKKLSRKLLLSPLNAGSRIAVTPKDQHIHFFTERGGADWWAPLDSTRLFPPIPMKDNIAVFMYPATTPLIRFFNWKSRQTVSHKMESQPIFPPVAVGGAIFCVTAPAGKSQVEHISNRRGLLVELEPEFPILPEHSLEFRITYFNLIKPEFHLKLLYKGESEAIWEETLPQMESPSRAWLPRKPGQYSLEVEGKSLDGFSVTAKKTFTVLDTEELIRNTLNRIHQASHGDRVSGGNRD